VTTSPNLSPSFDVCSAPLPSHMRVDSLARLLTFSDARPGSNVLVIESCKGIVTGAIAERVGGARMTRVFAPGRQQLTTL